MGVITGGYMPEYGKVTGGVMNVVTKSGGNEFHGDAWVSYTPGAWHGPQTPVLNAASSFSGSAQLSNERNFGADLGGYIIKDRLWFYAGAQFSGSEWTAERVLGQFVYQNDTAPGHAAAPGMPANMVQTPNPLNPAFGLQSPLNCPVNGVDSAVFGPSYNQASCLAKLGPNAAAPVLVSNGSNIQYIGKLTLLINQDHSLTLSFNGTPSSSGGNGLFSQTNGQPNFAFGPFNTVASQAVANSNDLSLKYSGAFNNKRQLLDITVGWHHQDVETNAADGSGPLQTTTAGTVASIPTIVWDQNTPDFHQLQNFAGATGYSLPSGACSTVNTFGGVNALTRTANPASTVGTCPVPSYVTGGPGFLSQQVTDSYQGRAIFTDLLQAAGHHVIKAGIDGMYNDYSHYKAYSGEDLIQESTINPSFYTFSDSRNYGFATAPDQPFFQPYEKAHSDTLGWGAFLQDSWQIFDKVTLNVGVRYDGQIIYGTEGQVGLTLPNQWAPRIGVIYDFTQQGRSKIYANYARYSEGYTLDMADRSFPSESSVLTYHAGSCAPTTTSAPPSSPTASGATGACSVNSQRVQLNGPYAPSKYVIPLGGTPETIDPNISPQSTEEFVVGGEYEIFSDARLGVSYTHRDMIHVVEDMSNDEAKTYFVGNPGYGIASGFPKATRNYDAFTALLPEDVLEHVPRAGELHALAPLRQLRRPLPAGDGPARSEHHLRLRPALPPAEHRPAPCRATRRTSSRSSARRTSSSPPGRTSSSGSPSPGARARRSTRSARTSSTGRTRSSSSRAAPAAC